MVKVFDRFGNPRIGDTGSSELVLEYLSNATIATATVAGDDLVLIKDVSDSNTFKLVTAQSIADLGGGGVGGIMDDYLLNDFADGDPLYLGKEKADGTWLLQRFSPSTGDMRYANVSNNDGLVYSTAWSGRASLIYGLFESITGV